MPIVVIGMYSFMKVDCEREADELRKVHNPKIKMNDRVRELIREDVSGNIILNRQLKWYENFHS